MPTVRELVTRFTFETDEQGAKEIENRVDNMKQGVNGLGRTLKFALAGIGAKAFFNMGQRADRAEFNLKRLAKTDFNRLRREFKTIQGELNAIREGAANVVTEKQFDIAAAGFLKVFGRGEGQFQAFRKIFTFAAKQAITTGQEVTEIVNQIQAGIQGGGFDALLELPGFDVFKKQLLEFQQQAIDPGDPGGRIALQNRLKAIVGIVTEATKDQNEALREMPDELLEVDKATAKTKDTLEKLGKTINDLLVPALNGINATLEKFNELVGIARKEDTATAAFKAVFEHIINPPEPLPVAQPLPGPVSPTFPGFEGGAAPISSADGAGQEINYNFEIKNTFHVPEGDAFSVARVVERAQSEQLKRAKASITKTEE